MRKILSVILALMLVVGMVNIVPIASAEDPLDPFHTEIRVTGISGKTALPAESSIDLYGGDLTVNFKGTFGNSYWIAPGNVNRDVGGAWFDAVTLRVTADIESDVQKTYLDIITANAPAGAVRFATGRLTNGIQCWSGDNSWSVPLVMGHAAVDVAGALKPIAEDDGKLQYSLAVGKMEKEK